MLDRKQDLTKMLNVMPIYRPKDPFFRNIISNLRLYRNIWSRTIYDLKNRRTL